MRLREATPQRRALALVAVLEQDADAGVVDAGQDLAGAVGGAVVDDQQLLGVGRLEHLLHHIEHRRRLVVAGHDDREAGTAGHHVDVTEPSAGRRATASSDWPNGGLTLPLEAAHDGHRAAVEQLRRPALGRPATEPRRHDVPRQRADGVDVADVDCLQPGVVEHPSERRLRVATVVADGGVEVAVEGVEGGRVDQQVTAGAEVVAQRPQRADVVVDVLEHVDHDGRVEAGIRQLVDGHDGDALLPGEPLPQDGHRSLRQLGGGDRSVPGQEAGERAVAGADLQDATAQVRRHERHDPVGVVGGGVEVVEGAGQLPVGRRPTPPGRAGGPGAGAATRPASTSGAGRRPPASVSACGPGRQRWPRRRPPPSPGRRSRSRRRPSPR